MQKYYLKYDKIKMNLKFYYFLKVNHQIMDFWTFKFEIHVQWSVIFFLLYVCWRWKKKCRLLKQSVSLIELFSIGCIRLVAQCQSGKTDIALITLITSRKVELKMCHRKALEREEKWQFFEVVKDTHVNQDEYCNFMLFLRFLLLYN